MNKVRLGEKLKLSVSGGSAGKESLIVIIYTDMVDVSKYKQMAEGGGRRKI